ncbi:MAG TPA: hypothetical protein VFO41_12045 [Alphaproteobacteria bacterium]|nr:hypothetical protein [Alphaproteobacteria bacterium]
MPLFGGRKMAGAAQDADGVGARVVVARHPGPALLVAADGAVLAASPAAAPLAAAATGRNAAGWWADLFGWLNEAEANGLPFRTSRIDTDRGLALIEWAALGLPDNTVLLLGRDVTVERHLRDALAESRHRLRDFVDLACDFAWETGADGCFVYLSVDGVLGHAAERLIGRPAEELLAEPTLGRSPFEALQPIAEAVIALRRADGTVAEAVVSARPLIDADGARTGARGVSRVARGQAG